MLEAYLSNAPKLIFGLETYNGKNHAVNAALVSANVPQNLQDVYETLEETAKFSPIFSIPKIIELLNPIVVSGSVEVTVGVGTTCSATLQGTQDPAFIQYNLISAGEKLVRFRNGETSSLNVFDTKQMKKDLGIYNTATNSNPTTDEDFDMQNDHEDNFFRSSQDNDEHENEHENEGEKAGGNDAEVGDNEETDDNIADIDTKPDEEDNKKVHLSRKAFLLSQCQHAIDHYCSFAGILPLGLMRQYFPKGAADKKYAKINSSLGLDREFLESSLIRAQEYVPTFRQVYSALC